MEEIAEKVSSKLGKSNAETPAELCPLVSERIKPTDSDPLDLLPSPARTQEVLDILDDQAAR
jgi:hypothetical protein